MNTWYLSRCAFAAANATEALWPVSAMAKKPGYERLQNIIYNDFTARATGLAGLM